MPKTYTEDEAFERFWEKVDRRAPSECWLWTGRVSKRSGYGDATNCAAIGQYGATLSHQVALAFILRRRKKPGFWALHRCDVKLCCNPAHIYEGTPSQNAMDRWDRSTPRKCKRGEGGRGGLSLWSLRYGEIVKFTTDPLIRSVAMSDDRLWGFVPYSVSSARAARPSSHYPGHAERVALHTARVALEPEMGRSRQWSAPQFFYKRLRRAASANLLYLAPRLSTLAAVAKLMAG